ncbi:MAG: hypothetical protein ACOCQY_04590, partial [Halorhabdus sp.]
THHGEVARALRKEDGPAAIAERALPLVEDALAENDQVVIDGIRSDVEVDRFQAAFGDDFLLVAVEAPLATRAERLDLRGRDATTEEGGESLEARDERELGFGMDGAIEMADLVIENTGTLSAFHERIETVLTEGPTALAEDDAVELRGER